MRARAIPVLAAVATVAFSLLVAVQPAGAGTPAQSAVADVMSGPFHIQFVANRAANAPANAATGTFAANNTIGSTTIFSVAGPVTCLDVRGNRMGLFYPITSSTPPFFAQTHGGVFVSLTLNAQGKPIFVGFLPTPTATANNCAPGLT